MANATAIATTLLVAVAGVPTGGAAVASVPTGAAAQEVAAPTVSSTPELDVRVPANITPRSIQDAANDRGDVVLVWPARGADGRWQIVAALRPVGGGWTTPHVVAGASSPGPDAEAPQALRAAVSPDGSAYVLWRRASEGFSETNPPSTLQVTSWTSAAGWDAGREIASSSAASKVGQDADLTVLSDGTVLVGWTTSPPLVSDKAPAGTAYVVEREPSGAWRGPTALGEASGYAAGLLLATGPGGAGVVWSRGVISPEAEPDGVLVAARRTGPGAWTANGSSAKVFGPSPERIGTAVDASGGIHVLLGASGNYGLAGYEHLRLAAGADGVKPHAVPEATPRQSLSRWLGAGYVRSAGAALAPDGGFVVVTAREGLDVERGGVGVGGQWAATRSAQGAWSVVPVDALGESTGATEIDLGQEPGGRLAATWSVVSAGGASGTCSSVVLRAVREPSGTWTRRTVAGALPAVSTRNGCRAGAAQSSGGGAPVLWAVIGGRLVTSTPNLGAAAPPSAWSARLVTRTWGAARTAGGLALRCEGPAGATCSASVIGAIARRTGRSRAAKRQRSAVACLELRASGAVGAGGGTVVLPLRSQCRYGRTPPTASVPVLVTLDAPGQQVVASRITVRVRR